MLLDCQLLQGMKSLLSTQLSLSLLAFSKLLSVSVPQGCSDKAGEGFEGFHSCAAAYSAASWPPAATACSKLHPGLANKGERGGVGRGWSYIKGHNRTGGTCTQLQTSLPSPG